MNDYHAYIEQDARLVILKELANQADGRLNDNLLSKVLDNFGYRRSREFIRSQLRFLADIGALRLIESGSVMVGEIKRSGLDHVERRRVLEGVQRPSPEE